MRSRVTPVLLLALVLVFAAGISCGGEKSSSVTNTPQAVSSPVVTPPADLRMLDLTNQADVRAFAQRLGGEVDPQEIMYADLTGDGLDEAIVPVSSGGTQGDFGFIVMGYVDGKLKALLSEAPAEGEVRVAVTNSQLVETLPVYESLDQPQFPSKVKNIYYTWDGSRFVVDHEETVPNPNPPPHA